ncbi:MAG: PhzF family phenazine biosynthesis protein [Planctomycetes bacterium]|nr:PhzF family phenazine biosynthesis protein [Planctomycetota bacterium]
MRGALQFRLVDAFADQPYAGNPAGVVVEADALNDPQMQAIAREINASETAFISRGNDLHRPTQLRWFTPTAEVDFCGHATLAAAHALQEVGCLEAVLSKKDATVLFDTAAGPLTLHPETLPDQEALLWWLQMPDPELKADNTNPMRTCELLGFSIDDLEPAIPIMRTRDNDLILLVKRWQQLVELKPDFQALTHWSQRHGIRGYCVATLETLSKATDVHSRFFAPAVGINEDPVTGSVHGPLATLLVVNELVPVASGRSALNCIQGEPGGRHGLLRALVEATPQGYRTSVGGMCFTSLTGELRTPLPAPP